MYKRKPIRLIALLMTLCMLLSVLPGSGLRTEAVETEELKELETASAAETQLSSAAQILSEDCKILNYVQPEVFASAKHVARITSEETLNSYVFLNEDGTRTAYFMDEAVKYVDEKGLVQEKDLTLVPAVGGYTTEKNDISLSIPTNPASGVTLLWNNTAVRIIPQGGTVGETVVEDNTVRYVDYYGNGMDLVYTPTLSGLKEDIVLQNYAGKNTFTFMLNTGGLNLYSASGRYYLAASKTATDRIDLGDVVTFDARGRFSVGTMSAQTVTAGQIYRLTLTVDEDFLTDPNTVYPVSIDPTLTVSDNTHGAGAIEDVSIYQGRPTINANWTYLHSGYYDSNYTVARTLIRLTGLINSSVYQGLTANQISSVQFHIWEASGTATTSVYLRANTGSATWTESGATWNNAGVVLGTTYDTQNLISNSKATFNITQLVKDWKSGTQNAQKGFVLQSSNETSLDKAFYSSEHSNTDRRPYVVLNYDSTQNSIAMSATTLSVNEGSTATIQAVTTPEDLALTWSSNNTSVATVDSTGKVTGVKAGVATITASAPGVASATCTVYVTLSQNAVYRIRNMAGATFLDCNGANIAEENLTNVQVQTLISVGNDKLAQMWRIIYIGGGFYHIRPMHKLDYALYLDGADVKLKDIGTSGSVTTENANARWTIEYTDGGYVFKNVGLFSRALQPVGGSTTSGKAVITAIYNSEYQYQRWSLTTMTLPPSGILLYDTATGLPMGLDYVYVQTGHSKSLTAAVYSILTINQSVTWSYPTGSAVEISSEGVLEGEQNGSGEITVSYTYNSVAHPVTYTAYSYTNSVSTKVKYDYGYEERYPQTQERIHTQLNLLQELYLDRFLIYVDFDVESGPFESLADTCSVDDIDALCNCGTCENTEVYANPWEVDDPIREKHVIHHKNYRNILFDMELPGEDENENEDVYLILIGHITCQEAEEPYHTSLAGDTKGVCYRNYRIAAVFDFRSDAYELSTMVHEFGHLFGAPDHYDIGNVPGTGSMGSNAFERQCIYGEDKNEPNVTNQLLICDGCKGLIEDNADAYTP